MAALEERDNMDSLPCLLSLQNPRKLSVSPNIPRKWHCLGEIFTDSLSCSSKYSRGIDRGSKDRREEKVAWWGAETTAISIVAEVFLRCRTSGSVCIDGVEINALQLKWLRGQNGIDWGKRTALFYQEGKTANSRLKLVQDDLDKAQLGEQHCGGTQAVNNTKRGLIGVGEWWCIIEQGSPQSEFRRLRMQKAVQLFAIRGSAAYICIKPYRRDDFGLFLPEATGNGKPGPRKFCLVFALSAFSPSLSTLCQHYCCRLQWGAPDKTYPSEKMLRKS
nr:hypothetical protein Iba_chr10aCG16670 [Ipomoea batatas]